jgi:hypothetical protein
MVKVDKCISYRTALLTLRDSLKSHSLIGCFYWDAAYHFWELFCRYQDRRNTSRGFHSTSFTIYIRIVMLKLLPWLKWDNSNRTKVGANINMFLQTREWLYIHLWLQLFPVYWCNHGDDRQHLHHIHGS